MASAWIRDGANITTYIAASPRRWGAVRLVHRPVMIEERQEFLELAQPLKARQAEREAARFVAGKIVRWDLAGQDDKPLPVTADSLLKECHPSLVLRIQQVVLGFDAGDEDPEAAEDEARQRREDLAEATPDRPVGQVREERSEKN